ncbi:MAG: enoyl-CoA hydratase/isomerase family protein, partial [Acidimicrobiales bacterium]
GAPDGALDGVDMALCEGTRAPPPWVSVADVDLALEALSVSVGGSPLAAATLAQVLRSGRSDSLDHDLVLESLAYSTLQGGPEFHRWLATRRLPLARAAEPDALRVERDGDRISITLNRPDVANAYNASMRDELCAVLSQVSTDPSIEEVHLYGAGAEFCSGGDLAEFGLLADPVAAHLIRTSRSAARLLGISAKRVVAHLHGACIGAGIELPALAANVIAAADTRIRLPEVAMGLIPGAGGTASLPRRIGRHRTLWMALSGESIDAATALAWGLVDRIAPA